VAHAPYALQDAVCPGPLDSCVHPLVWNGLALPGRGPDHIVASPGVDVRVGGLCGVQV
jgi:hypothetical protein